MFSAPVFEIKSLYRETYREIYKIIEKITIYINHELNLAFL